MSTYDTPDAGEIDYAWDARVPKDRVLGRLGYLPGHDYESEADLLREQKSELELDPRGFGDFHGNLDKWERGWSDLQTELIRRSWELVVEDVERQIEESKREWFTDGEADGWVERAEQDYFECYQRAEAELDPSEYYY